MAKDTNAQIFPNAEIIVPAAEHKFWTDAGVIGKLPEARQGLAKRIQATLPTWKNVEQVEEGKEAIPGVKAVTTYGHTPGHTSFLVASGRKQLLVLGDVANIPALFVKNPGWHAAFDQDAALAESNRRKTFDRVVADKITVTGYHFGMPGAGAIRQGRRRLRVQAGGLTRMKAGHRAERWKASRQSAAPSAVGWW